MSALSAIPVYDPVTNTVALGEPGNCVVCGPAGQAFIVSVRARVDEPAACPACTPFGARWLVEEITYRWRTSGGVA
jgi:hypothetical protein